MEHPPSETLVQDSIKDIDVDTTKEATICAGN